MTAPEPHNRVEIEGVAAVQAFRTWKWAKLKSVEDAARLIACMSIESMHPDFKAMDTRLTRVPDRDLYLVDVWVVESAHDDGGRHE